MTEPTWTTTRSQMTDALCRLTAEIPLFRHQTANVNAESMAEAILAQLPQLPGTGTELIAAERQRQVTEEGCTPEHDATHWRGDLVKAAVVYALSSVYPPDPDGQPKWTISDYWPRRWKFKPAPPVRMLAKAGALIAAEIDRLIEAAGVLDGPEQAAGGPSHTELRRDRSEAGKAATGALRGVGEQL